MSLLNVSSGRLLGTGAAGSVYESSNKTAIKSIPLSQYGLLSIIEPALMKQFSSVNLMSASNVAYQISEQKNRLYISMEQAKGDLRQILITEFPSRQQEICWMHSLCCAVHTLHKNGVIHGDIKAENVLVFEDNSIKLTDFSLSVVKWNKDEKFTSSVSTLSHIPLEALLPNEAWDLPLDIWCLGCTLFSLIYRRKLFSSQLTMQEYVTDNRRFAAEPRVRKQYLKEARARIFPSIINNLLDYDATGPYGKRWRQDKLKPANYERWTLPEDFWNASNTQVNEFIFSMLRCNPSERVTIEQCLQSPLFDKLFMLEDKLISLQMNLTWQDLPKGILSYVKQTSESDIEMILSLRYLCALPFVMEVINNFDIELQISKLTDENVISYSILKAERISELRSQLSNSTASSLAILTCCSALAKKLTGKRVEFDLEIKHAEQRILTSLNYFIPFGFCTKFELDFIASLTC